MTRKAYEEQLEQAAASSIVESVMTSAMRKVKNYQQGVSEVPDSTGVKATHIHHMFPKHAFPDLADMLENLIALTPGQHLGIAHPDGNTQKIDLVFQRTCLNQKLESIKKVLTRTKIYTHMKTSLRSSKLAGELIELNQLILPCARQSLSI